MNDHAHRPTHRRHGWSLAAAIVLTGGVASSSSCLVANDDHCIYRGGDLACGGDSICVLAPTGKSASESGVSSTGCFDGSVDPPDGYMRVQYGLPTRLRAAGDATDLASVEGVLRSLVEDDGREVTDADVDSFDDVFRDVAPIRRMYEKGGSTRGAAFDLDAGDVAAIIAYGDAITEWLGVGPPGTGTETDGDTDGTGETDTDTADTTASETTGPQACIGDGDCTEPGLPFCTPEMTCGTCDQTPDPAAACAGLDPAQPICLGGQCVQCTVEDPAACVGATPVCDGETNTCVPCTEHGQCGEAACNLFTGECLPDQASAIAHVGSGQEFPSISAAVASFGAGADGTVVVYAGAYDNQPISVDGGRVLAFLAAEVGPAVQPPRWTQGAGGSPQLIVGDATVLIDGVQISGNASSADPGVLVDGGRVWLDRSRVIANFGGGIVAQAASELVLRNCFVGGDQNDINSLVVDASTASILYSTVGAGFGVAAALTCDAASTVTARNSLFVARTNTDEVQCDGTFEFNAAEQDIGGTNEPLGPMNTNWFAGYATGNFHLMTPPAAVATTAQWQDGDPATDIDGETRPATDGTADVAGADVP